jgi:hypothetical protein
MVATFPEGVIITGLSLKEEAISNLALVEHLQSICVEFLCRN